MEILIPEEIRFLLLGAGDLAKYTISRLRNYFNSVLLVSNSEWDQAWSLRDNRSIFDIAKEKGISSLDTGDYDDVIKFIDKMRPNLCLTMGSKWIFKSDFLDFFKNRVFNYHPARLPEYRGGGGFSWQIMNNIKHTFVTIHQMVAEVDAGPIVLQKKRAVNHRPIPRDFHAVTFELAKEVAVEFLESITANQARFIELTPQTEDNALYFPLLDASVNGAIDFSWNYEYVERFIRSFSYPYNGAFTFKKKKLIQIMEAEIFGKWDFHPFCRGLVTGIFTNGDVKVICREGTLRIKKIKHNDQLYDPAEILKLGNRLHTPEEILEKGRNYRPRASKFTLKINKD